jgi:hypothetical protein
MEDFLRKIKLIHSFSITLNTSKSEFTSALRSHVDEADIDGFFSGAFEALSSSNNRYKGLVSHNTFRIRKRRRFFEKNIGRAIASGELREQGESLLINTKVNAWTNYMFFFYGFITLFYLIFIGVFFTQGFPSESAIGLIAPVFIFIHAAIMFGLPYFVMRKSVKNMTEDLEREFHFIISKSNIVR